MKKGNTSRRAGRGARSPRDTEIADDLTPPVAQPAIEQDLPLSGRRILLVDDNAGIATLVAGLLQDAGAAVDVSRSADAAVAQAVRREPAMAIIHLPLPRDAAAQLSRRLRRHETLAALPVIILSGEEGVDLDAAAAADVVQPRPISPQRLLDDVARLLRRPSATPAEEER